MRTIIAGSREVTNPNLVEIAIAMCGWNPSVVISGTASGADKLGEYWANKNKTPVERYPADWDLYGKSAGYKRNVTMAENAESLIAIWNGYSKGTYHMIKIAKNKGLRVYVYKTVVKV